MMKLWPLLLVLLCGCRSMVPANRITIKAPQGSYDILTPKNVTINNFSAKVETNGVLNITFASWTSTNDAGVIDKASAGQVAIINAWKGLLDQAIYSAANGAVAGATK